MLSLTKRSAQRAPGLSLARFWHAWHWLRRAREPNDLARLPDRLARDAGVDPVQLEPHRLRLPSQDPHRPWP